MNALHTAGALLVLAGWGCALAAEVPAAAQLGGKDFYPSPECPVGFRGDGNGYFPGATPVTEWQEGTPVKKMKPNPPHKPSEVLVVGDDKGKNIVWKTEMPAWANTQPVVVGDRVFSTGEPNLLICVDANSGKVLWTRAVNAFEAAGLEPSQAAVVQDMAAIFYVVSDFHRLVATNQTNAAGLKPWVDAFVQKALPRLAEGLKKADPAGNYEDAVKKTAEAYARHLEAMQTAKAGEKTKSSEDVQRNLEALEKAVGDRIRGKAPKMPGETRKGGGIPLYVPWGCMIGWGMSVPVSDGQYVYVSFAQGQSACFDLNGNRIWQRCFPQAGREMVPSPLLAGDVFVVMHGQQLLRGLDKKTGRTLWETDAGPAPGGYVVGSHKVVRLTDGDRRLDVIVTTHCTILRASDGKTVGKLPYQEKCGGGPSIIHSGDIVCKGASGDGFNGPFLGYRLKWASADKVEAEKIWELPRTPGQYHGQIATSKFLVLTAADNVLDPQTGKALSQASRGNGIGDFSNVLAGHCMLWCDNQPSWQGHRIEGQVSLRFYSADLSDPQKPKRLSDQNVLGGVNLPRMPAYETYAPELLADKTFWGCWGGRPNHFMHVDTGLFPSGNRLFIRSVSHLYCIGDPAAKYDWNPESRPKEVQALLQSAVR